MDFPSSEINPQRGPLSAEFQYHLWRLVTYSLSPVKTITLIPALFNLSIAIFALSFGGSKNAIKPITR